MSLFLFRFNYKIPLVNPYCLSFFNIDRVLKCAYRRVDMHLGKVVPSHPNRRSRGGLQNQPTCIRKDAPRSRCRPSAIRLEVLTSPHLAGSQDYPTVPGSPVAAVVIRPATRQSLIRDCLWYRQRLHDEMGCRGLKFREYFWLMPDYLQCLKSRNNFGW